MQQLSFSSEMIVLEITTALEIEQRLESLCKRFQSVGTPTVILLVARMARLQLENHQRTGVAHKAARSIGSSLRGIIQRLDPQWSANEVRKFSFTGKLQLDSQLPRVDENAAEL